MEPYQTADEQLCTVFGRLTQCLVKEEGIANRAIQYSVENVCKCFALEEIVREQYKTRD